MRLDITFRNLDPSDSLKDRAEKKFAKVAKHLREPIEAHLVLHVERHHKSGELTVHSAGEQTFTARERTEDAYATIDGLMTRMERTVRRARERTLDRAHQAPPEVSPSESDAEAEAETEV